MKISISLSLGDLFVYDPDLDVILLEAEAWLAWSLAWNECQESDTQRALAAHEARHAVLKRGNQHADDNDR